MPDVVIEAPLSALRNFAYQESLAVMLRLAVAEFQKCEFDIVA